MKTFLGVPLSEVVDEARRAGENAIKQRLEKGLPVSGLDARGKIVQVKKVAPPAAAKKSLSKTALRIRSALGKSKAIRTAAIRLGHKKKAAA
ncbi:hypothetical protein ACFFU8_09265 [Chromobacterium piscinae]|uniref:hypothetical protein n=1 Tax=Chromobacterium piscinae TaxID=686831 RepID=UPI001E28BB0E|nr:hypothetical protein [Chromobacterium piscinae]MCD5327907.1 hypothetical protein [Chromobacterium piscinae]